jgi:hypothetical protein
MLDSEPGSRTTLPVEADSWGGVPPSKNILFSAFSQLVIATRKADKNNS